MNRAAYGRAPAAEYILCLARRRPTCVDTPKTSPTTYDRSTPGQAPRTLQPPRLGQFPVVMIPALDSYGHRSDPQPSYLSIHWRCPPTAWDPATSARALVVQCHTVPSPH